MGIKDLKNLNYRRLLFDHGEKIGLAAAGLVALLLVIWLFVPGSGLFAESASSHAETLTKSVDAVNRGLSSNKPGPDDDPQPITKDKLAKFTFDILGEGTVEKDYAIPALFDGRRGGPGGRQTPTIKLPVESDVAVVHFQLPSLVYSYGPDGDFLATLKDAPASGPGGPGGASMSSMYASGGMSGSGAMSGSGGMSGFSSGRSLKTGYAGSLKKKGIIKNRNNPEEKGEHDYDIEWKKSTDIKDLTGARLAHQLVPERVAEIVASFPYKAQLKEFQEKLGLPSDDAVLAELAAKGDKAPTHTFRFLGYLVDRRAVDAQGRPIDAQGAVITTADGGWAPIDLQDAYAPLIVLSGGVGNLEKETRFYKVAIAGLTLPKLPTAGAMLRQPPVDEYPDLEDNLPTIKKTVDDLDKNHPNAPVAKPSFTQSPDDIFNLAPSEGVNGPGGPMFPGAGGPGGTVPSGGPGGPMPRGPMGGPGGTGGPLPSGGPGGPRPDGASPGSTVPSGLGGPRPDGMGSVSSAGLIPDYCLIRMFDFNIEPGKTYEYRIKVRMTNPNFERKDVAAQGMAADPELTSKDWYVLPKKLVVPSDLYVYAVDQAKLDAKDKDRDKEKDKEPKLPSYTKMVDEKTHTVLQIQKWVDDLQLKDRKDLLVGDWVIAVRVLATRGEPIGRQRVEVPYWRMAQDRYVMATDQPPPKSSDTRHVDSVEVAFTAEGKEPILVDFQKTGAAYTRTHPKTDDAAPAADQPLPVEDPQAPEQVLVYTANGKLLAHDAAKDAVDPERVKRLADERHFIEAVKTTKGGKDDNLFPDRSGAPKAP